MGLNNIYIKVLYISYFFFSWAIGFTVYSNSSVIESISGRGSIGIIYGVAAVFSLILSTWIVPSLINFVGNRRAIGLAIMLEILAIIGIRFTENSGLFAVSFVLFLSAQILISFNFDIFFEHNTLKESSATARGAVVSLQHIGRMLGPILAAFLAIKFGIKSPYNISLILMIITGITLYFATMKFKDKAHAPASIFKSLNLVLARPAIRKSLTSIILLHIFYALMVTFVPVYLADVKGIGGENLGLLFTIMLTPFVVLGYPIGKHIDSGSSGRRMARYGLLIMAITTLVFPFIDSTSLIIWGCILLLSRIGAVMLETAGEGIFFRSINEEETELLGIMRDMQPIGYFIASLISVITLMIGNIKDIFYIVGFILILGIISTTKKKIYAHK